MVELEKGLLIYSKTQLLVDNTVTIKAINGEITDMLKSNDRARNTQGKLLPIKQQAYNAASQITVKGGNWDANYKATSIFRFRRNSNVTIADTTLTHSTGHTINVSASKNVTISKVTIKDSNNRISKTPVESDSFKPIVNREVIHLDYASTIGEPGLRCANGTAVQDITIENCKFENVFSAIGNHVDAQEFTAQYKEDGESKWKSAGYMVNKETTYGKNITIRRL